MQPRAMPGIVGGADPRASPPVNDDDQELIARIRRDRRHFGTLFDLHYAPMKKYVLRRVGDYHSANDIVSETFLKAFLAFDRFTWRGVPLKAWLYRIATNEVNQYFRRRSRYVPENLHRLEEFNDVRILRVADDERRAWELEEARHAQFRQARAAINTLPVRYAEVLALRFFEQLSPGEVAVILGKPEGTVKSLCARGLEKVRAIMDRMQPNPP
jgi:RNA polymerase sigma-70 factor, ECF subfamily